MARIKKIEYIDEQGNKYHHDQYLWFCPGCNEEHAFAIKEEGGNHQFNMDLENPTVSPSLVADFVEGRKCHTYIKEGIIEFLDDCWHELKGSKVELPQIN
jgi:hypothetical protein